MFAEIYRGIKTTEQFIGCIRNLELNDDRQDISAGTANGDVNLSYCPAT